MQQKGLCVWNIGQGGIYGEKNDRARNGDFCKVYDMGTKEQIERILLANRISYSCRFEKQGFFSKLFGVGEKALCTFRIHDEEVPRAKRLVASVLGNKNKRKEIKK